MPRKFGTVLTDKEKAKVVFLLKSEIEVEFIAERLNIHKQTVYNIAKDAGFKFSGRGVKKTGEVRAH